jgi:hypothetical protein
LLELEPVLFERDRLLEPEDALFDRDDPLLERERLELELDEREVERFDPLVDLPELRDEDFRSAMWSSLPLNLGRGWSSSCYTQRSALPTRGSGRSGTLGNGRVAGHQLAL